MNNTDILLIYPQLGTFDNLLRDMPLSLIYAATESVKHGYTVKILDLRLHPDDWEIDCVHMICDWMAMGYKFGDTARQYYESHKDKINLPEIAIPFIYEIFDRIESRY